MVGFLDREGLLKYSCGMLLTENGCYQQNFLLSLEINMAYLYGLNLASKENHHAGEVRGIER